MASTGELFVRDSRTNREYIIPISHNAVSANEFKKIAGSNSGASFLKTGKGLQIYDPGLENTAIKQSHISSRDPKSGLPCYRGYTTQQLWGSDFEDLFHLMVFEKYPNKQERESLRKALAQEMLVVPQTVADVVRAFPRSATPMAMLLAGLSAYVAENPAAIPALHGGNIYNGNQEQVDRAVIRTASAYAVVLGLVGAHKRGVQFVKPSMDRTFYENLFTMMGHVDAATGKPDPMVMSCFKRAAILNADNGMTQSSFVLVAAASSLPDPMSALISAVSCAYGPLHYGAQEAGHNNLAEIGSPEGVPAFLEKVKRGERRLFGYGHRSLAAKDARLAPVMEMLDDLKVSPERDPLLRIAKEIDRLASLDDYFIKRHLCANADFYTVFLFTGMGFESDMIACANLSQRLLGFMAHWRESMLQKIKLFRPLHIYVGPPAGKGADADGSAPKQPQQVEQERARL